MQNKNTVITHSSVRIPTCIVNALLFTKRQHKLTIRRVSQFTCAYNTVQQETFKGENISRIGEKYDFHGENFCGLLTSAAPNDTTPQIAQKNLLLYPQNCKICKSFLPQKFSAIRYQTITLGNMPNLVIQYCGKFSPLFSNQLLPNFTTLWHSEVMQPFENFTDSQVWQAIFIVCLQLNLVTVNKYW